MKKFLTKNRWSPYTAGALIGLLSASSILFFNKSIGTSSTFSKIAAFFWSVISHDHLVNNVYYKELLNNKAWFDWQFLLVIGIFIGSFLARRFSQNQLTPVEVRFSLSKSLRPFFGGLILMLGARLAGGCTSGHAISGGSQLALSGWLFMMGAFALGIPTALVMYRKKNGAQA